MHNVETVILSEREPSLRGLRESKDLVRDEKILPNVGRSSTLIVVNNRDLFQGSSYADQQLGRNEK